MTEPTTDAVSRLRHVNVMYATNSPDLHVIAGSSPESPGLTWGALRELEALVEKLTADRQVLTELAETAIGWPASAGSAQLAAWNEKLAQHRAPAEEE